MAKLCNWYEEFPKYVRCDNFAEPGEYRCEEHPKEKIYKRSGDLTEAHKDAIRQRDNYQCAVCGEYAIEVDHIEELALFSDADRWKANLASNLQLLCKKHHKNKTNEFRESRAKKDDDMYDRSISARARKKRRLRNLGYGVN